MQHCGVTHFSSVPNNDLFHQEEEEVREVIQGIVIQKVSHQMELSLYCTVILSGREIFCQTLGGGCGHAVYSTNNKTSISGELRVHCQIQRNTERREVCVTHSAKCVFECFDQQQNDQGQKARVRFYLWVCSAQHTCVVKNTRVTHWCLWAH